ncbi:type II toxin-antitoxin system RelE/ParE family toxin [Perlucidibaca piscinae]|uniref:type II toxin-antitoxin system RelE/ParE family toxin n=1 Tax=Perlucidibaca piscinae TaxID=392589 RepID=UPI0003B47B26|nr:plasmid stabilization protein [Perlucidibaca piscinae]
MSRYCIVYTDVYNRRAARFLKRHPTLISQYRKAMSLLELDPFHPSLRLHKLEGRMSQLHSISINLSYRVVIHFLIADDEIVPVDIGDHDRVYR